MKLFENGFRKAGANVAHCFVAFVGSVIASQEESAVYGCTFASAKVCAQDDKIQGIANAGEVVLFHFEPVATSLAGLVATLVGIKHLDHESFAGRFHALVKQRLDLLEIVGIAMLGE